MKSNQTYSKISLASSGTTSPVIAETNRFGISERLLLLVSTFIMLAEILIYIPSIAQFRDNWLGDRLAAARVAALVIEAAPPDSMPDSTIQQMLSLLQAKTITLKIGGARRLLGLSDMPPMIDRQFDLREPRIVNSIIESFDTLLVGGIRTINVMGSAPMGGDFVDIVIDEAPLRAAMLNYSGNFLVLSLIICAITAILVYQSLHKIIIKPVSQLVYNITNFAGNPENTNSIILPSVRKDEIGRAEQALYIMQTSLLTQLKEKRRLASLGLAVAKINHDLRNMLASVQLFSERLIGLKDPTVQRLAPKLIQALDRAIDFCETTLSFGKGGDNAPKINPLKLVALLEDVRETLGIGDQSQIQLNWDQNITPSFTILADGDYMFRVLVNLGRNAMQALKPSLKPEFKGEIRISAKNDTNFTEIIVFDNGPGIPEAMKIRLFEAFNGSGRAGSTGLGLAIAADLVRAHGGTLELVDSHIGACFKIRLPAG